MAIAIATPCHIAINAIIAPQWPFTWFYVHMPNVPLSLRPLCCHPQFDQTIVSHVGTSASFWIPTTFFAKKNISRSTSFQFKESHSFSFQVCKFCCQSSLFCLKTCDLRNQGSFAALQQSKEARLAKTWSLWDSEGFQTLPDSSMILNSMSFQQADVKYCKMCLTMIPPACEVLPRWGSLRSASSLLAVTHGAPA